MVKVDTVALVQLGIGAAVFAGGVVVVRALNHAYNTKWRALPPLQNDKIHNRGVISEIAGVAPSVVRLRTAFESGVTWPVEYRVAQLRRLKKLFLEKKEAIIAAVQADLGKPRFEIVASEYHLIMHELNHYISHVHSWVKPTRVRTPIGVAPAVSEISPEPRGVVLDIAPWNYPVNLCVVPLIASIAAGNCTLVKFSRHSVHVARLFAKLLPDYLDMSTIAVEGLGTRDGGARMITEMLTHRFDHIFFTGSVSVGKVVAAAAAKHLTTVTLELGGKNPVYIGAVRDLRQALKRVVWGKTFNAGQSCIGCDYLLVPKAKRKRVVALLKELIVEFFGEEPRHSADFARIISVGNAKRLRALFATGTVVHGGDAAVEERYVAPTVLVDVDPRSATLTDEIFGPVLPIVDCESADDAVHYIRQRPSPLALYVFSDDAAEVEKIRKGTQSGSFMVNHVLQQFVNPELPFGGVGDSGVGAYHGKRTFDVLSHQRSTIRATCNRWLDPGLIYPPYKSWQGKIVEFILKTGL